MAVLTEYWLWGLSALLLGLFSAVYLFFAKKHSYWQRLGVPQLKPSFPFGDIGDVFRFRKHIGVTYEELYYKLEGQKFGGLYHAVTPSLLLRDPELIKAFLIKDFASFHDRGFFMDEVNDPLSIRLFNLSGKRWKHVRNKLTPAFSSGSLKNMFNTIADCAVQLEECVEGMTSGGRSLECKEVAARYSTDVIASTAFGVSCNCLVNPDADFRRRGRELLKPGFLAGAVVLGFVAPWLYQVINFAKMPASLVSFFRNLVSDTMEHRTKNNVVRHDILQLMIGLVKEGYEVDNKSDKTEKITLDHMAAQVFGFYVAGFETSSSTISFCLYELSKNPDVQQKLHEEIDRVIAKHGDKFTYESIMEMEYLEKVFSETLRKYSVVPILNRMCTEEYKIPGSDVVLPVGTYVVVPVRALHHDPQYYPDPERFDPERFSPEVMSERHRYAYLPFGEGPRSCVGMRLGLLQTKIALVSLLKVFQFRKSPQTPDVLEYHPSVFFLFTKTGIHLDVTRRKPKA